jgi:hypothetical protein
MRARVGLVVVALTVATSALLEACSCSSSSDGASGDATGSGGDGGGIAVGNGGAGAGPAECTEPCAEEEVCSHGVCVPLLPCANDDECQNDTYCDPAVGCLPWQERDPAHDETCVNAFTPGILSPAVKCEFSAAPAGDPFPGHVDVQGTPIVVNFNKPAQVGPPSIVASFTATVVGSYTEELGVVRVLRGDDCTLEANLGGTDLDADGTVDWTVSSASLAAGDLDGDGVAEIVAYGADGSTMALTRKQGTWALLWKAPHAAGMIGGPCDPSDHRCPAGWAGPSIHDLDDDGAPEVVREGAVFGADGTLKSLPPAEYQTAGSGLFPVLANLDGDAAVEMTNGHYIWEWLGAGWALEPYFPGASTSAPGHVAVAEFGDYGSIADAPELVVVRASTVIVYAASGEMVQGPVAVPGPGGGGPPTISDFDGDGLAEVGVAGQAFYTVYDIDCGPSPRQGGTCAAAPCDFVPGACPAMGGIAWSRSTQDLSSNVTGSSIFDFEADGRSEVVYGDECFVRVYDGQSGDVLFSQYRSSCTWYENPIIADTDGNFRADLVSPSNRACSPTGDGIPCATLNAEGVDPQFPGLRCEDAGDCVSGVCDGGLCRCTTGAECCAAMDEAQCLEEGLRCATPEPTSPGSGNTCRAAHPHGVSGIRVYRDANDKWVRSRTIWNQHAYAVTHVEEDGTVPQTSAWQNNWDQPGLNNFRQNVPGNADGSATGDFTAGASGFSCNGSAVTLKAPVCNRGADDIAAGVSVGFYLGGELLCATETSKPLAPEECEVVSCDWASPPTSELDAVDVTAIPNDQGQYAECKAGNNEGIVAGVYCEPLS